MKVRYGKSAFSANDTDSFSNYYGSLIVSYGYTNEPCDFV